MEKNRDVLVVGGGIAGMQSALLLAEKNRRVYVMDKAPAIGGYFSLLELQFPTNSCGACFMSPNPPALCPIYEHQFHPNIKLLTNSDIESVNGEAGNFEVAYASRPTCVDPAKCTLCGKCTEVCPIEVDSEFGEGVESRKAIYLPYPHAIPRAYVIDKATCTGCGKCVDVCKPGAINLQEQQRLGALQVGAIVLGFGFEPFQAHVKTEFGLGRYKNVLSSIQYERMLSYSSPANGRPKRLSDGKVAQRVAFIECVGSRDRTCGNEYCSSVCCMFIIKQAIISKRRMPDFNATVFYMDVRAFGKNYERYYESAQKEYGVRYLHCAIPMVREQKQTNNLLVTYGTEDGQVKQEEFDMVVLATGLMPPASVQDEASKIGIELNEYKFCSTREFTPTSTSKDGVFVAGVFRKPRDIAGTVIEACSAAADVAVLLDNVDSESSQTVHDAAIDEAGARVGVFVCDDKGLLTNGLDVERLIGEVSNEYNVQIVETIDVTSIEGGVETITTRIKASDINRIILAGYRGLELERRLKKASMAGLYADSVEVVNIGEQCVNVHRRNRQQAQEKATLLLKAAIRKTWEANPVRRVVKEIGGGVLIVGGGITGMTSSLTLADQGIAVTLIERAKELGGLARTAYYTIYGSDIQVLLKDMVARVENHPKIEVLKEAELKHLKGSWGNFTSTVATNEHEQEIAHGALILATGGHEHTPTEYLYGKSPHVVTQRELDAMIAKPETRVSKLEIRNLDSVVMIQCVGSRDEKHPYCSHVCCIHAVKSALKLKELNPDINIYVLYRDVRTYGFFEKFYFQARDQGVLFIRYNEHDKPQVSLTQTGLQVSLYDHVAKEQMILKADLLVLSAGIEANDVASLAEITRVQVNDDGFFAEANPKAAPLDARDRGKFFAGLAHSPLIIEEAICQGKAAAERAAVILWNEQAVLPETQSFVKELVCTGCGQCVQVCPYNAISLHPQKGIAVVDEFLCQGCGTCAGTCRVQAIDIKSYGDIPLLEGLNTVLGQTQCMRARLKEHEGTDWEPTIMTFICSWCAAGAADLAGDSQFQYGHGVHFVKVPCVGRLNPLYIIKTLQKGADGVLIVGCHPRDCHFISGNLVQARTFEVIKKYMGYLGMHADRVQFSWVSASEGAKFAGLVNKLVNDVKKLGPQKQMVKSV